jgi:two-component system OmpR family sensor kinase
MTPPNGLERRADAPRTRRRRLFGQSIRVRLAVWHTLTIAALLAAFATGTWVLVVRGSTVDGKQLTTALLVAGPLALLLAGLGGYLLARASLAPVAAIARQAERISAGNLHERLPVENPRDELGALATVLNGLLGRLENAFLHKQKLAEQRLQFLADASHELRTPVAALSTVASVVLAQKNGDPAKLGEALAIVRGEAHRLGRLVEDLLFLSRADAGELPLLRENLFLDDIVRDSARAGSSLAASRDVRLNASPGEESPFVGDPHSLRRLVMILIDNAIKYTPAGGEVWLSLERDDIAEKYRIIVEDTGPGVPDWAVDQIFERFFRAGNSRAPVDEHDRGSNAGLGLAIARFTAESYGGSVQLEATGPGGSRFVITLPMPNARLSYEKLRRACG